MYFILYQPPQQENMRASLYIIMCGSGRQTYMLPVVLVVSIAVAEEEEEEEDGDADGGDTSMAGLGVVALLIFN